MSDAKSLKPSSPTQQAQLLVLNQMAGPMTWELVVDLSRHLGPIVLLTGHPDTLSKGSQDGVTLWPACGYQRGNLMVRFCSWLRYAVHAFCWLWRWPRSVPILVFSNPPLGLWVVRLIHLLRGTPYAVMVHDIFPDVLLRKKVISPRQPLVKFWSWLNRHGYQAAELVMTLGQHMATTLSHQFDATRTAAGRIEVVPPWSDDEKIQPLPKSTNWFAEQYGQTNKLTIMYSGNMGLGHDLESMLRAAEQLEPHGPCHFMFIGAGPKWELLHRTLCDQPLTNVTLLGWQAEDILPYSMATADIGLVSLESELSGLAVPSKAFNFLAANVPLLAVCEEQTELADMIRQFDCGAVVPPHSPQAISDCLRRWANDPELRRQWQVNAARAKSHFRRRVSTDVFAQLLSRHLRMEWQKGPTGGGYETLDAASAITLSEDSPWP